MDRLKMRASEVLAANDSEHLPSPCQSICRMDERTGLCVGCWRTLPEIAQWSQASEAAKRQVWLQIQSRLAASSSDAGGNIDSQRLTR